MHVNRNNENTSNPIIAYIKYELVLVCTSTPDCLSISSSIMCSTSSN